MKPLMSGFVFVIVAAAAVIGSVVARETSPGAGVMAGLTALALLSQLIDRKW
ncbi:MAG TPA: hypothetical protein VF519_07400 [Mycobacteriales bacterium]|jgi:hypothetical protein